VLADVMMKAGTLDKDAVDKIPVIDGPVTVPTPDQTEKATKYLADNWATAVG
jgi:putative spermidine/putrescine transport system substrate-binding protein